jgi:diguanylate cyclase (GGDEF)-like protein
MSDSDSKVVELGPGQNLAEWFDFEVRKLQEGPPQSVEELRAAVEALRVVASSAINTLRQQPEQVRDSLTGVGSRRQVEARLWMEWERSRRYDRPLSVVAIEVNRTAATNGDGPSASDAPISSVGSRLVESVRASDFVGRIVGDEFVVICPEADEDAARGVTTKVIELIASGLASGQNGQERPSVSAGWATRRGDQTADQLLQDADRALYLSTVTGGLTTPGQPEDRAVPSQPRSEEAEREAHYRWMKRR